jgi:Ferritin-like domain
VSAAATRRDALRQAGGAALAAAATPLLVGVREAFAKAQGDEDIMLGAVRLEQSLVVTYGALVDSGSLDARASDLARRFGDQEQQHLDAVTKSLQNLGGVVPADPAPGAVKAAGQALTDVHTQPALLAFAGALESAAIGAYYEAQQALQRAEFLQTTASIMANEGQHLALLREAMNRPPVPNAFETGRS